jgi:sarcosine oxidase subunit alpha
MRPQINRLPENAPKGFAGTAIDRNKPLRFRLDGRIVSGFAGDTVLSAALAAGIDTVGQHRDSPIGLTSRAHPAISHASLANDPQFALPMARTPAQDGAEFVTFGVERSRGMARLFQPGRTLGLKLDAAHPLSRPWRTIPGAAETTTDLLVIGGGVAGLSAALAGARAGLTVTLVEAREFLGGHSGLFGTQEGEDAPEASMARLSAEVDLDAAITVLTATQVFSIRPGLARAHRIETAPGTSRGRVIDIAAARIIIATGALERLPIFAGNRLPGVTGCLDAYELAARYGVWTGQRAIVATGSSPAYRLAMLASDAGIGIDRILEARPESASRFIAFSRAYGIVQSPGTVVASVGTVRGGGLLAVHTQNRQGSTLVTDRLLVCGGWQPDLTLWHIAGGASAWDADRGRLAAQGDIDSIALAGSAAGYFTRRGCIQSGADAVDQLLGRERRPVDDPIIDPLHETPDGPLAIAAPAAEGAPSYLDAGIGLLQRPAEVPRKNRLAFWRTAPRGLTMLSEAPQALAVNEVAAGVDLALIPADAAGIVAQERVASVPLSVERGPPSPDSWTPIETTEIPAFLIGRYGPEAKILRIIPEEARILEPGALIFPNTDTRHPDQSIGVILRHHSAGAVGIVAAKIATEYPVTVREQGQFVRAQTAPLNT